jgi:hypothetical protein
MVFLPPMVQLKRHCIQYIGLTVILLKLLFCMICIYSHYHNDGGRGSF